MKRILAGMAAALLAVILFFPGEVHAVSAEKAISIDAQTKRVIYERKSNERSLIASTTKIMTALVVCEQCNVLDRVKIPKEAVGIEGSSMYLREGEILTVQELLYGLMLHSGNDAAVALAIYCGGTVEGFAELMNDKARQLEMANTHFVNPNGLDNPDHYSTAKDLAILAAYAMKNPIFVRTVSAKTVNIGVRSLRNHNKLLWMLEGADGIKTGFTKAAGRILVSSVLRQGRRLITVTINDPDDWRDHCTLAESGFSDYQAKQIVTKGEVLGTVQLISGESSEVTLVADSDFIYALAADEKPEIILQGPGFFYAPVVLGQPAGVAYVCLDNVVIGKVALTFGDTVELSADKKHSFWDNLFGGSKA